MNRETADAFKLTVLNPGGRDAEQYFSDGAAPNSAVHAPVNFHGFAACTRGSFHRDVKRAIAEATPVLLLLRGDFKVAERALSECRRQKRIVVISLKETGLHQIAQQLSDPSKLARFFQIARKADGCIATTPEAGEIYRQARAGMEARTTVFIPTPYPLGEQQWDFSIPPAKQFGIFVGTREWDVPSRNHFAALLLARQLCQETGEPVTVFNLDGRKGERLLSKLDFPPGKLRVMEKRRSYPDVPARSSEAQNRSSTGPEPCPRPGRGRRPSLPNHLSAAMERSNELRSPRPAV